MYKFMDMHIHTHVCGWVFIHTYMHIYFCVYTHIQTYTHVYIHILNGYLKFTFLRNSIVLIFLGCLKQILYDAPNLFLQTLETLMI